MDQYCHCHHRYRYLHICSTGEASLKMCIALWKNSQETSRSITVTFGLIQCILGVQKAKLAEHIEGITVCPSVVHFHVKSLSATR